MVKQRAMKIRLISTMLVLSIIIIPTMQNNFNCYVQAQSLSGNEKKQGNSLQQGNILNWLPIATHNDQTDTGFSWITFIGLDGNVWIVNPDHGETKQITEDAGGAINYSSPSWATDGERIALASVRDGNQDIYIINLDEEITGRLTDDPGLDSQPDWSPDGNKIAYTSDRDGNKNIYLLDLNDGTDLRLTNREEDDFDPAWSPDGTKIYFASREEHPDTISAQSLYEIDLADSNISYLLQGGMVDFGTPAISPKGNQVGYTFIPPDGLTQIYVSELDNIQQMGINITNTFTGAYCGPDGEYCQPPVDLHLNTSPVWSTDGDQIAYVAYLHDWQSETSSGLEIRVVEPVEPQKEAYTGNESILIAEGTDPDWWAAKIEETIVETEVTIVEPTYPSQTPTSRPPTPTDFIAARTEDVATPEVIVTVPNEPTAENGVDSSEEPPAAFWIGIGLGGIGSAAFAIWVYQTIKKRK